MREIETFDEPRERAFGRGSQILAACAVVLIGFVFVAGVLVGKNGSSADGESRHDPLTRLDRALAAEEPEPASTPLTFHRTLVEPEAPSISPSELGALGMATPRHDEQGATPPQTAASVGAAAAVPIGPVSARLEDERPAAPAPVQRALAKQLTAEGSDGPYTLQVASYQDEQEARETSARLRASGFRSFILAADIPDRGTWYRVRIGPYRSQGEVDRARQDYEERLRAPAIVVKREQSGSSSRRRH